MSSSAFSFHCMICFEEFDPLTNYPVVLPCGHTYVCIECANRLDKCMECREPLITKIEVPSSAAFNPTNETIQENTRYSYTSRRYQNHPRAKYGPPPQKTYITKRLPLPKNAVLLSLIQASEPARRRTAEIQQQQHQPPRSTLPPILPSSPSEENEISSRAVKFNQPSPLFFDPNLSSSSSPVSVQEHHMMGTNRSRVLPTTTHEFDDDDEEHKIRIGTYLELGPCGTYAVAAKTGLLVYPTLLEGALPTSSSSTNKKDEDDDDDGVSRDVENMVKNSYRNKFYAKKNMDKRGKISSSSGGYLPRSASCAGTTSGGMEDGMKGTTAEITLGTRCDADGNSEENVAVEAQFTPVSESESGERDEAEDNDEENLRGEAMSDPGGSLGLYLPSPSVLAVSSRMKQQNSMRSTNDPVLDTSTDPALSATLKLRRQFSLGPGGNPKLGARDPDFDGSLIRLKFGDRVQVVSMDSRGWVKLARGYGYIRLENDKQLVKVGGTSDKACQIEAMLHELSLERNRLKHEQKKLEHLSAGLMIDLQCSLLTSDDTVIVHAPQELALMAPNRMDRQSSNASKDDLEISKQSRTSGLTPARPSRTLKTVNTANSPPHQIRTAKSHSPGSTCRPPSPPYHQTTPGGSAVSSYAMTPTRVNFRTGLSGHRALSSSHSHPHDFIQPVGPSRSMSNHAGLGSNKTSKLNGRSIY